MDVWQIKLIAKSAKTWMARNYYWSPCIAISVFMTTIIAWNMSITWKLSVPISSLPWCFYPGCITSEISGSCGILSKVKNSLVTTEFDLSKTRQPFWKVYGIINVNNYIMPITSSNSNMISCNQFAWSTSPFNTRSENPWLNNTTANNQIETVYQSGLINWV